MSSPLLKPVRHVSQDVASEHVLHETWHLFTVTGPDPNQNPSKVAVHVGSVESVQVLQALIP